MTPVMDEICDEVLTANDIEYVADLEEFMIWLELLEVRIKQERLGFEFPNFRLYSSPSGAKYYWPFIKQRRDS